MRRKKEPSTEALKLDYLMAAAYFWYRAENMDEQMVSVLNRMKAQDLAKKLQNHTPSPEEVQAYAATVFPAHKRHA